MGQGEEGETPHVTVSQNTERTMACESRAPDSGRSGGADTTAGPAGRRRTDVRAGRGLAGTLRRERAAPRDRGAKRSAGAPGGRRTGRGPAWRGPLAAALVCGAAVAAIALPGTARAWDSVTANRCANSEPFSTTTHHRVFSGQFLVGRNTAGPNVYGYTSSGLGSFPGAESFPDSVLGPLVFVYFPRPTGVYDEMLPQRYTITEIINDSGSGEVKVTLSKLLTAADRRGLSIKLCDRVLKFSDATENATGKTYTWSTTLRWNNLTYGGHPVTDPVENVEHYGVVSVSIGVEKALAAPRVTGARVNGTSLTLTFDKTLDSTSTPAEDAFTVQLRPHPQTPTPEHTAPTVSSLTVSGSTAVLTLTAGAPQFEGYKPGLLVGYTPPASAPLKGTNGTNVRAFTDVHVRDDTATITGTRGRITGTAISAAGSDNSWENGETLDITYTFSHAVTVAVPSGATLAGGPAVRFIPFTDSQDHFRFTGNYCAGNLAPYHSGSGTTSLVFRCAIVNGPHSRIGVPWNALVLRNPSTLWVSGTTNSVPWYRFANRRHGPKDRFGTANAMVASSPEITGTPSLSALPEDGDWSSGDTVEATLTFTEAVAVDTTGGTPSVTLRLGGTAEKTAGYLRGSGTTALVFGYTLTDDDETYDSVLLDPDSLTLNGGTIRGRTSGLDALLAHSGVATAPPPIVPRSSRNTKDGTEDNGAADGPSVGALRLVGGDVANEGRLEIFHDGQWGTVCDDRWGDADADVACRVLGYEEGSVDNAAQFGKAYFGAAAESVPIWLDDVLCTGSETSLLACPRRNAIAVGTHNCRHREDVGVRCVATAPATTTATVEEDEGTPAAAFTVSFHDAPAEHAGSGEFHLEVRFSEEPAGLSYKTIRDHTFAVEGGSVTGANRLAPPSNQRYRLRVRASSNAAVTIALREDLPACDEDKSICTPDGRALAAVEALTVPGPATLSVSDARVREAAGATLEFTVSLDRARSTPVTVRYATEDGTARSDVDYTAVSGTLTFAAGETSQAVSVAVLDDAHDEGDETMELVLSNATGAPIADARGTGTIENNDPMPRAWAVRFGRSVGGHVVEGLAQRLGGGARPHVTVAGVALGGGAPPPGVEDRDPFALPEWAAPGGREPEARTLGAAELLLGSSFHLSSAAPGAGGAALTAWGRVETGGFDAEADAVTMDGDVTTGLVGFDAEWERLLAGVLLSQSAGDGAYRLDPAQGDDAGEVESDLTGIYPYARLELDERVFAWGLAGGGSGSITLARDGHEAMKTDLSLRMGALGLEGRVLDGEGASGIAMQVKSDAMWVRTESARTGELAGSEGDVTRVRLIVEGERVFALDAEGRFTPSAQVGLRHDGGDAESGTGLEVGAGVHYARGALSVEGQVRTLLAHEESGYREWGASGAIRLAPGAGGRGLTLGIRPEWGRTASAAERLWSVRDAGGLEGAREFEAERRLVTEVGYGFALSDARGLLTPYAAVTLGDGGRRTMRSGVRWRFGSELAAGLEATRARDTAGEEAGDVRLRAALRF